MMNRKAVIAFCAILCVSIVYAEDPDYGNDAASAFAITTDGTEVFGYLASGDQDWFSFTPSAYSRYRIDLTDQGSAWTRLRLYQNDIFGTPQFVQEYWASNETEITNIFIEFGRTCYLQADYDPGNYSLKVTFQETVLPDTYSNLCGDAAPIAADGRPVVGTLDHTDPFDTDWFVFDTEPLHMYRVQMSYLDNSWAAFSIYDEACGGNYLWSEGTDFTVVSWFGESYHIYVRGDQNKIGNYYSLSVTDLGQSPDDHANIWEQATAVPTDGTVTNGIINYVSSINSDQDWFKFTPTAHGKYRLSLTDQNGGWTRMRLYHRDTFGQPQFVQEYWASNDTEIFELFFEYDRECFLQTDYDLGSYSFSITFLETVLPDTYPDLCADAHPIAAGDKPLVGTLDHTNPYDSDWFVFQTQPLHTYRIRLSYLYNSWAAFLLYPANCGSTLYGDATDITVTSWFGEDYRLNVRGDVGRIGNLYTLWIEDLGRQPDDYPNVSEQAFQIPKDGTFVDGSIQYTSTIGADLDWFTFLAGRDGSYQFRLNRPNGGWSRMRVYSVNEVGTLVQLKEMWSSNNTDTQTLTLAAGRHYIQVDYDPGGYRLSVLSPEPRCGDLDHPYPPGDTNRDCYVDLQDLAAMAGAWLTCTDPNPPCGYIP